MWFILSFYIVTLKNIYKIEKVNTRLEWGALYECILLDMEWTCMISYKATCTPKNSLIVRKRKWEKERNISSLPVNIIIIIHMSLQNMYAYAAYMNTFCHVAVSGK